MLYTLEQGPVEQNIIKTCLRERLPFPRAIQNAPELWMGLGLFFSAYIDLDSDRSSGWAAGPIPWSVIKDYAKTYNIIGEQRDDLFYHVRAMDKAYLKHIAKKKK